jgi:hypothetical protein
MISKRVCSCQFELVIIQSTSKSLSIIHLCLYSTSNILVTHITLDVLLLHNQEKETGLLQYFAL